MQWPRFKVPSMRKTAYRRLYPISPYTITLGDVPADDVACTLTMRAFHNAAKHRCDHDKAANRIEIHLKAQHHVISSFKFVFEYTYEGVPLIFR